MKIWAPLAESLICLARPSHCLLTRTEAQCSLIMSRYMPHHVVPAHIHTAHVCVGGKGLFWVPQQSMLESLQMTWIVAEQLTRMTIGVMETVVTASDILFSLSHTVPQNIQRKLPELRAVCRGTRSRLIVSSSHFQDSH